MLGKDHEITSAGIMGMVTLVAGFHHPILIVAGTAIGSLIPDLDSPTSTISKQTTPIFSYFFTHRGFLHSIFDCFSAC